MAGVGVMASVWSDGDGRRKKARAAADDIDEDDLFELDIALLDGRHCSADEDDHAAGQQHALLGNCLLPVSSVSSAVPVDATSELSSKTTYPYSGYHCSRRLVLFTGSAIASRRFFLGRSGHGNSARFRFETYFQRY